MDEFHKILWMPEALIIHRYKYGNITDEWRDEFNALDLEQRTLAEKVIIAHRFEEDIDVKDRAVKNVLQYYQIKR